MSKDDHRDQAVPSNRVSSLISRSFQWVFNKHQELLNFLWWDEVGRYDEKISRRLQHEAMLRGVNQSSAGIQVIENIEGKATALLQHISIMIALTSALLLLEDSGIVLTTVLALELLGYIWAALAALRCLLQVSTNDLYGLNARETEEVFELEAFKRELIFRHAHQCLVVLTVIFAFIFFAHLILGLV